MAVYFISDRLCRIKQHFKLLDKLEEVKAGVPQGFGLRGFWYLY